MHLFLALTFGLVAGCVLGAIYGARAEAKAIAEALKLKESLGVMVYTAAVKVLRGLHSPALANLKRYL